MSWNMIIHIRYTSREMFIRIIIATLCLLLPVCASAQIGYWKVAPEYDNITKISPELYRVEKSGLYGLLGKDGKTIVPCQYEIQQDVVENRCLILSSNHRLKAIYDGNGNPIKQFEDKEVWYVDSDYPYYSDGVIPVCNNTGRWTYMDRTGALSSKKPEFRSASPYFYGYAVVRYKDGSYMHINKRGVVSKLDSQFKDNFLVFASSFTPQDKSAGESTSDPVVSLIVDSRNNVFLRDRSGMKVESLGTVKDWDKNVRKMTTDRFVIFFEPNKQIRSVTPVEDGPETVYNHSVLDFYKPDTSTLACERTGNGYRIVSEGKEILPTQFTTPVTIVSGSDFIAARDGKYGVVTIDYGHSSIPDLQISQLTFDHHVPAKVSANVALDPSLDEAKYHFVVTRQGEKIFDGAPHNGVISFEFLPEDLSHGRTETFNVQSDIDGIKHPESTMDLLWNHKNPYSVKASGRVRLNKSNSGGTVTFTVTNESEKGSDKCDIVIDGNVVKKGMTFQAGESVAVSAFINVDIMDLDSVSKTVSVQVRENGCPAYRTSKNIIFERNL